MQKKVLFAIGHPGVEQKLAGLISNPDENPELSSLNDTFRVVGTMVSQTSILDFLKKNDVDILVYRECDALAGDENDFKFIINLRTTYPNMRIIFIGGAEREPGDKDIPKLVTYAIYDIIAGQTITIAEMCDCILHPKTLIDATKWLPQRAIKDGIFGDDEMEQIETIPIAKKQKEQVEVSDIEEEEEEEEPKPKGDKKGFGISLMGKFQKKKGDATEEIPIEEDSQEEVSDESDELDEEELIVPKKKPAASLKDREPLIKRKPKDTAEHMDTPLMPGNVREIRVPSRAAADEAAELAAAKKEIEALKKKVRSAEKKVEKKEFDLERAWADYSELQQKADAGAKQRICMFYGSMPGVGCSTLALNVATYLALKKYKVIYIEFNNVTPTLSYWYDFSGIDLSLDRAFAGIETRNYQDVAKNIVTKQVILESDSEMRDKHEKYPDLLHYMFFADSFVNQNSPLTVAPPILKDLLLLLLYKDGYDYVIIDMYTHSDYHLLEAVSNFSTTNVFVMTQDVVTIGTSLRKFGALESSGLDFEMLKESESNRKNSYEKFQNFKNFYVVNKFRSDSMFTKKRVNEWLEAEKKTIYVPENTCEIYNATYKALPVILTSKNKDFATQIKRIAESI